MAEPLPKLATLRRPGLLMQAVAIALPLYQRRLQQRPPLPATATARLPELFAREARLEEIRRKGDVTYSVAAHIEALVRLIAEARCQPGPELPR
ncbi:DUF6477 family protein [Pseudogemmobacter faecipullorum]|uniref:Uncharacterized protein n=1 Tax=Pseudogemmobacter faecipullorum TaxID=2755041 RepID=A0ABS8CJY9_9RHOB|nr:DUF6477 family protein [Pseudogemmobacter faecipullorum]MCB5409722.1 hypothetical protein [Pseudogemmobacter faecipullorum]